MLWEARQNCEDSSISAVAGWFTTYPTRQAHAIPSVKCLAGWTLKGDKLNRRNFEVEIMGHGDHWEAVDKIEGDVEKCACFLNGRDDLPLIVKSIFFSF
jgi:hypothetical protein